MKTLSVVVLVDVDLLHAHGSLLKVISLQRSLGHDKGSRIVIDEV